MTAPPDRTGTPTEMVETTRVGTPTEVAETTRVVMDRIRIVVIVEVTKKTGTIVEILPLAVG